MKKFAFFILVVLLVGLCATSAFACAPPWWTAEDELPSKIKNLYCGKAKASNRFQQMVMSGYRPKSI